MANKLEGKALVAGPLKKDRYFFAASLSKYMKNMNYLYLDSREKEGKE